MSATNIPLLIDQVGGQLLANVFSQQNVVIPPIVFGTTPTIEVGVVNAIPGAQQNRQWQPIDISSYTLQVGVGQPGLSPIAGSYTLTYGASTTGSLAFSATAAQISTALNAIASIISAGGVTVSAVVNAAGVASASYFVVTFLTVGIRTLIIGNSNALAPISNVEVLSLIDGTANVQSVQSVRLNQNAGAAVVLIPGTGSSTSVVVDVLTNPAAGVNGKYLVQFNSPAIDGTFSLSVATGSILETVPLPWNATATQVQTALQTLSDVGPNNCAVTQNVDGSWIVTWIGALAGSAGISFSGDGSGLLCVNTQGGVLNCSTGALELILGGAQSVPVSFEVQMTPSGGTPVKILQATTVLNAPILTPSTVTPPPLTNPSNNTFLPGITFPNGGTANDLDSIATQFAPRPQLVEFYDTTANALRTYILVTGTTAASPPSIVHPTDYNATSNQSIWIEVG